MQEVVNSQAKKLLSEVGERNINDVLLELHKCNKDPLYDEAWKRLSCDRSSDGNDLPNLQELLALHIRAQDITDPAPAADIQKGLAQSIYLEAKSRDDFKDEMVMGLEVFDRWDHQDGDYRHVSRALAQFSAHVANSTWPSQVRDIAPKGHEAWSLATGPGVHCSYRNNLTKSTPLAHALRNHNQYAAWGQVGMQLAKFQANDKSHLINFLVSHYMQTSLDATKEKVTNNVSVGGFFDQKIQPSTSLKGLWLLAMDDGVDSLRWTANGISKQFRKEYNVQGMIDFFLELNQQFKLPTASEVYNASIQDEFVIPNIIVRDLITANAHEVLRLIGPQAVMQSLSREPVHPLEPLSDAYLYGRKDIDSRLITTMELLKEFGVDLHQTFTAHSSDQPTTFAARLLGNISKDTVRSGCTEPVAVILAAHGFNLLEKDASNQCALDAIKDDSIKERLLAQMRAQEAQKEAKKVSTALRHQI